jgi:hypothetical protein
VFMLPHELGLSLVAHARDKAQSNAINEHTRPAS